MSIVTKSDYILSKLLVTIKEIDEDEIVIQIIPAILIDIISKLKRTRVKNIVIEENGKITVNANITLDNEDDKNG